jgi:hypothetical protein
MLLTEARKRLLAATKRGSSSFTNTELDYAIQGALHDMDLWSRCNRQSDSLTLTAGNPELSLTTIEGFRPDRVTRVELAYTDRGAWSASSVSYAVNDIVTNNAKFYVCETANVSSASNEPGVTDSNGVWQIRNWKRGDRLDVKTYDTVARMLGDSDVSYRESNPYVRTDNEERGKPSAIGFLDENTGYVFPVPDIAYPIKVIQESPIVEWLAGTCSTVDLDLPMAVLLPVIDLGAAWRLEPSAPINKDKQGQWMLMKDQLRSRLIIDVGDGEKDEAAFRDYTDGYWISNL